MDEVITDWTTPGGGGQSVMYVAAGPRPEWRLKWIDYLAQLRPSLSNQVTYNVRNTGRQIDDTTGTLIGEWLGGSQIASAGTSTGPPVPDASQALIRWRTPTIVRGRFLRGRTFIPGLTRDAVVGGNLVQSFIDAQGVPLATLLSTPGLLVWSRPTTGNNGTNGQVTSGSYWNEFAVMRKRRNR